MAKFKIGPADEVAPGERRLITISGRSIGVFNVKGTFYALRNSCVHNQGPVCLGEVGGTYLPSAPDEYRQGLADQVLRCPWHGWEFDITTSRSLADSSTQLKSYPVTIEEGQIVVDL